MDKKTVSVIIPIYNEEGIIEHLITKLKVVAKQTNYNFEFIFVNDGSYDNSLKLLLNFAENDRRIKIIDFSRNFGQQAAISAGIDYSKADATILMDADMEDNPEHIIEFLKKWEEGYDVVYAIRKKRKTSFFRKICFNAFHYLNRLLSEIPVDTSGIFGLLDRKVVEKIKLLNEQARFFPGLRRWIGFRQIGIELERGQRYDSKPRVTFNKLFTLALDSYLSFSKKPLRVASILGVLLSFVSFLSAILIIIFQLLMKFKVPGWASMVTIMFFISGIQFLYLGILGEYIGRIFDEAKKRPLYIINDIYEK